MLASGSGIREALIRRDWSLIQPAVPDQTIRCLRTAADQNRLVFSSSLDQALMARLRTMDSADFASLPDCSEGLEQALQTASRVCITRKQILNQVSGKRYPRSRINRLCTSALLGLQQEEWQDLPDCALIIGVRSGMESLLRPTCSDFPLLTRSRDYPANAPWFRAERRAADLWALAAGLSSGLWEKARLLRD